MTWAGSQTLGPSVRTGAGFRMIVSMPPSPMSRARHSTKDLSRHIGRRFGLSLLAIALFLTSAAYGVYNQLNSQIDRQDVTTLLVDDPTAAPSHPVDDFDGRPVNILIMGSDVRREGEYDDGTEGMRSDTTVIFHLSADRKRIDVVSIPRDTMLSIPSCKLPDGSKSEAQSYAMFNSAFSTGANSSSNPADTKYAAACAMRTVANLTGMRIENFMVIDFSGFESMVNALGGVPMYLDEPIEDQNADLSLSAGCQRLNGQQALGYARTRYSVGDGSDISRISRQQKLMAAMMRAAMNKNLLTEGPALYDFISATLSSLTVDPAIGNLSTLAGLAMSMNSIGMQNVNFITMPNTVDPLDDNRVIPTDDASTVWEALRKDAPIPGTITHTSADGSTTAPTDQPSTPSASDGQETTPDQGAPAPAPAPSGQSAPVPTKDPALECR